MKSNKLNKTKKLPNLKVYKSYDDFATNPQSINGCSVAWLKAENLTLAQADKSLLNCTGLWNCYSCKNVHNSESCSKCNNCKDCIGCYSCSGCEHSSDLQSCHDCYDCESCIDCFGCNNLNKCWDLNSCSYCNNVAGLTDYKNNSPVYIK